MRLRFAVRPAKVRFMNSYRSANRRYEVRLDQPNVLRNRFDYNPLAVYNSLTVAEGLRGAGTPAGSRYGPPTREGFCAQVFRVRGQRVYASQVIWAMVTDEAREHADIPTRHGESNSQAWSARGYGYAALILPYLRSQGLRPDCLRIPGPADVALPMNAKAIAAQALRFASWSQGAVGAHHIDAALADLAHFAACGDERAHDALLAHLGYDAAAARLRLAREYIDAAYGSPDPEPLSLI